MKDARVVNAAEIYEATDEQYDDALRAMQATIAKFDTSSETDGQL
jgi:hypothetical protein